MKFNINDIAVRLGVRDSFDNAEVDSLMIDSRSVVSPATTLFVALRTPNNDGHAYIPALIERGVRNFVVSTLPANPFPGINYLLVPDTLDALQQIGAMCRDRIRGLVVGITGSRGKTVVKEFIAQALDGVCSVSRSPRSFNSQIGVPLALWSVDPDADIVIVEAGVSRKGEMERLERMIRPDVGILTEITDAHSDGFSSRSEKISEKLILFRNAKTVIGNPDIDYSTLSGKFAPAYSLLSSFLAYLGFKGAEIEKLAAKCYPIDTRLNVIDGVNGCRLMIDRFTADIPSLRIALDFMRRRVPPHSGRTLVLASDFPATPHEIESLVADYGITRLLSVDSAAIADMTTDDFYNEAVILRGTPSISLEPLYALLEAKQHETLMEVNLDAVVHNFNFFRSKVKPSTGVICMLKAQGYGAGSVELARTLQTQGAAYLAVAVVDEGVELRQAGISMPVMVLNPRAQNYKVMFDNRLEPEIYSFDVLDEIIRSANRYGVKHFPVHIKLDTGMRRLGFLYDDMEELARRLNATDAVVASTIFSHLACADDPDEDDYTLSQFETFDRCCNRLSSLLPVPPKRHILNSTGIIRFPDRQYDFVRLGIGLYGIPTLFDGSMSPLRNVSTLTTPIISIKHWKAGDTVGYNRRGRLDRDSVIATIPVGYADGIDRHLGYGKASMIVNGHRCPTVGSICMDICMIDVTDVECRVGDRVEVFGSRVTPVELADTLSTIPYEILTSVSPRVKRVYFRE